MNNTPEEWLELAKEQLDEVENCLKQGVRHDAIVRMRLDSAVGLIAESKNRLEREEYFSRPENRHKVMPGGNNGE